MTEHDTEILERLAELEQRVSELEDKGYSGGKSGSENDLLDRYDTYVVENTESVEKAHPRKLMKLYAEAGVVNKNKQKQRSKRLKKVVDNE